MLVECIPNISLGNNSAKIEKISSVLSQNKNVTLLNVDSNVSANRTVFTFVLELQQLQEVGMAFFQAVAEQVDMSFHRGEHPRIGAVDVFPVVPLSGSDLNSCIAVVNKFADSVSRELNLPIYLYEKSALDPRRKRLEACRSGQYEKASEKIKFHGWKPDFGNKFNPRLGVSVIGVRDFLIAFNVNLAQATLKDARLIAEELRESGNPNKNISGMLKAVKAIGWEIQDFNRVQVSTNIVDYHANSVFKVFDCARQLAKKWNCSVSGSELIGLIPLQAIRNSVAETGFYGSGDEEINFFCDYLNLREVKQFIPQENIIELKLKSLGVEI